MNETFSQIFMFRVGRFLTDILWVWTRFLSEADGDGGGWLRHFFALFKRALFCAA
jgi:hypothetical protein